MVFWILRQMLKTVEDREYIIQSCLCDPAINTAFKCQPNFSTYEHFATVANNQWEACLVWASLIKECLHSWINLWIFYCMSRILDFFLGHSIYSKVCRQAIKLWQVLRAGVGSGVAEHLLLAHSLLSYWSLSLTLQVPHIAINDAKLFLSFFFYPMAFLQPALQHWSSDN